MSSDSSQPEPGVCPDCHKPLPPGGAPPNCPECGTQLSNPAEKQLDSIPLSPFDDLFDEQGSPRWGEATGADAASPVAEEPLEFPGTVDPFATEDDLVLSPLEGEPKELFDFDVQRNPSGIPAADPAAAKIPAAATTALPEPTEPASLPLDGDGTAEPLVLELGDLPTLEPAFHSSGSSIDDPNRPLRIEGLESESPTGELASVRCRICDSLVYIQPSQLGTKVKCPECYSEILAEQAAPRRSSNPAFQKMQADSYVLSVEPTGKKSEPEPEDEYRLSEPVERPKVDVPIHYGLEPEQADLLAPLQPPANNPAPRPQAGTAAPAKPELPRPAPVTRQAVPRADRAQETPTTVGAKAESPEKKPAGPKEERKPAGPAKPGSLPPYWQQRPTQPEPVADDSNENKLEIGLEELTVPGSGIMSWLTSMVQDAWFWICFGIATFSLGFGYWSFDLVSSWLETSGDKRVGAIVSSLLVGIPGLAAFLFGMALTVILSALLFHLGGRKQPRLSDWKGYHFNEWAPAVGFVSFAFALAALPGLLLGILLALLSGSITLLPILVAVSVTLLAPLFAIGVCRSDSPFGVFDSKVFKLLSFEDVDWLKYLPGSLAAFFLFLIGTLFLLLNGLIWSTLGAAAQVAGWAIFGSLTGLYSGLMVDKVNRKES